jgi:hypothetical protein
MKRSIRSALAIAAVSLALGVVGTSFAHPGTASIGGLEVKFENDRVRVLALRLKPGERERQHTHPQYVLYAVTDYQVRNTSAEPITHGGENIGNTELRALIVELKPPQNR